MERWPNYPQMHASFPWSTATADQIRAHIASEPNALKLNAYQATPLHFAAGFGAPCEVIEALLDAKPEWASATCTWGDGGPWKKAPLVFGLVKQAYFDEACVCSAEVASLLAARCPASASDETGNILEGAPTAGDVGSAVVAAAQAKIDAAAAAAGEQKTQPFASRMAQCEEEAHPVSCTTSGEVARAFVASPRAGSHELALALLAPECRTQGLLSALSRMEQRMQSARDTAKWLVVETGAQQLQAASATIEVESQSTTGGGSAWTTTKQRLTLKIDVSAACPITQVVVHEVTNA